MDRFKFDKSLYRHSIIVFLDLLGFKHVVEQTPEVIGPLLYELKNQADMFLNDQAEMFYKDIQVSIFSDSIFMTIPTSKITTINEISYVFGVVKSLQQSILIEENPRWLSRGYITKGTCYHKDDIIYGEGYIKALQKEHSHHDPKVIVDASIANEYVDKLDAEIKKHNSRLVVERQDKGTILQALNELEDMRGHIRSIDGGPYFIDYLNRLDKRPRVQMMKNEAMKTLLEIIEFSKKKTKDFSTEVGVSEKYIWLTRYASDSLQKLQN